MHRFFEPSGKHLASVLGFPTERHNLAGVDGITAIVARAVGYELDQRLVGPRQLDRDGLPAQGRRVEEERRARETGMIRNAPIGYKETIKVTKLDEPPGDKNSEKDGN